MAITIVSFGYLHRPAPWAHLTLDLREHFRDPAVLPVLRQRTAADPAVRQHVMDTAGVPQLTDALVATLLAYRAGPVGELPLRVAVGCAGGRHRAPTIATAVAARLRALGVPVELTHRDLP